MQIDDDDEDTFEPEPAPKQKTRRKARGCNGTIVASPPAVSPAVAAPLPVAPPALVQHAERAPLALTQASQHTVLNVPSPRRSHMDVDSGRTLHAKQLGRGIPIPKGLGATLFLSCQLTLSMFFEQGSFSGLLSKSQKQHFMDTQLVRVVDHIIKIVVGQTYPCEKMGMKPKRPGIDLLIADVPEDLVVPIVFPNWDILPEELDDLTNFMTHESQLLRPNGLLWRGSREKDTSFIQCFIECLTDERDIVCDWSPSASVIARQRLNRHLIALEPDKEIFEAILKPYNVAIPEPKEREDSTTDSDSEKEVAPMKKKSRRRYCEIKVSQTN